MAKWPFSSFLPLKYHKIVRSKIVIVAIYYIWLNNNRKNNQARSIIGIFVQRKKEVRRYPGKVTVVTWASR